MGQSTQSLYRPPAKTNTFPAPSQPLPSPFTGGPGEPGQGSPLCCEPAPHLLHPHPLCHLSIFQDTQYLKAASLGSFSKTREKVPLPSLHTSPTAMLSPHSTDPCATTAYAPAQDEDGLFRLQSRSQSAAQCLTHRKACGMLSERVKYTAQ